MKEASGIQLLVLRLARNPALGAHQGCVLHVVPQQPCVVEGVLGFLLHSIYRPLLHLMLDGLEELVQRLPRTILEQRKVAEPGLGLTAPGWEADPTRWSWAPGRWTLEGSSTPWDLTLPPPWGPTLRYWYRQIDIQLDSILSTTVSDLKVQKGFVQGTR